MRIGTKEHCWLVTGPARFPVAQNRKRMEIEDSRRSEMLALIEGAGKWAARRFRLARDRGTGGHGETDLRSGELRWCHD